MALGNNFHITVKPAGALCNLQCGYCYFLSKQDTLGSSCKMDDVTLENFIKTYIEAQSSPTVFFTWHGGEPTLLGVEFFKKVVALQKKHNILKKQIENDLQTNGLLIDDAWCKFLKENKFLIGLSVDGDEEGNSYRADGTGKPCLDKIIKTAKLLCKYQIPFNTLTVVNNKNSQRPRETYNFLKNVIGSRHMQFIPLVETKDYVQTAPGFWDKNTEVADFSVTPEGWGNFLLEIFNEWHEHDQGEVFVYLFENFLSIWLGRGAQSCLFEAECSHAMVLDRDGCVYACDHFAYPEYLYGNINETPLSTISKCQKRKEFARLKPNLPEICKNCKWTRECRGECPKKRFLPDGRNYLCAGYKHFFEGINERMIRLSVKYGQIK